MNKFYTHLKNETDRIVLTPGEKRAMLSHIHASLAAPVISPYQRFFAPQLFVPAFAIILIIGSGTAYAAQGALPGSPLYGVKLHVNERIEAALATTPEAKVQINAQIAERRIEEVQVLAASHKLDSSTTATIEANFDYHTSQAAKFAEQTPTDTSGNGRTFATRINASLDTLDELGSTAPAAAPTMRAALTKSVSTENEDAGSDNANKQNVRRFVEHARANLDAQSATSTLIQAPHGNGKSLGNHEWLPSKTACTMDAKICPDGTAVGRTGPNCSFADCPGAITE